MGSLLVPIDASVQSMQAVRFALALSGGDYSLTLLHVIPPFPSRQAVTHLGKKTVEEFQLEEAKESLKEVLELVQQEKVPFNLQYEFGEPHEVISNYARQGHQAVVMGTHGYGRMTGYLFNSVSYPTLHDVTIPVFLVPEEADIRATWRKLVVAVDGSEHSKRAAVRAMQFGKEKDARYLLLTVITPPAMYAGVTNIGWVDLDGLETLGEEILRPYETMFMEQQLPYDTKVVVGDPATVIKEVALKEEADVIVLGHHGLNGIVETLMGSVTYKVIHRTQTPLLIVRE
ncbi:universal stress protein [Brevibacillus sp. H7]|jgi:nucleotide-binding universal stress UspA family protein|uniref:universal stress protein n=1 Tax=Brevibacillus sp. H7 TaxID=3349138 RepID=UPI0038172DA1